MKKKIILFIVIIIALVLLVPIPFKLRDGGSIEFKALLYTITKYHRLDMESETGVQDGIGIKILGMEVYNNLDKNKIQQKEFKKTDIPDAVMVDGRIYYSTGQKSTITGRCGNMDGYISSTVQKGTLPTKDDESNFGTDLGYQKIKTNEIEVKINGDFIVFKAEERAFELIFNKTNDLETRTIIKAHDNNNYSYNIFSYGGEVAIKIDNVEYDLKTALLEEKITMEEIIEKANKDAFEDKTIKVDTFKDGGSNKYYYDDYAIIKHRTLDGNSDVYIGFPDMMDPSYVRF